MQRYKCAKMKLELGKGHTANGWQTLNLNPHLFTEKTVNVPQSSLQKPTWKAWGKSSGWKRKPVEGKSMSGAWACLQTCGLFRVLSTDGSAAVTPPTAQPEPAPWHRPRCDGSQDSPDAALLCSDEPWSRKSPSEDRPPGPQPRSSPRSCGSSGPEAGCPENLLVWISWRPCPHPVGFR